MMAITQSISRVGVLLISAIEDFGRFAEFAGAVAMWILVHPLRWFRWRLLGPQFYAVGVATIPVVAITGAFIGMVLSLESFTQFEAIGQEGRLGGVINVSVTKQIGPVLAAVMVAGRVGCALAAELGTMRVTEQLDALRAMAADPILYLVVPRFLACLIMTPMLTIYSDILGVWGGWLITVQFYGVSPYDYWDFTAYFVNWWEPTSGLIKSVFFGGAIGLIACYKGFNCNAGAAGVGKAATESFVASFIAIIVMNLVLAKVLNEIGVMFIYGEAAQAFG
jgi:phospholipid/cholesterol/gamma-HCH transport system permease protein